MDLTSILPLLMGGKNPDMAKILTAMNNPKSSGGSQADLLASLLANQNKGRGSTDDKDSSNGKGSSEGDKNNSQADNRSKLFSGLMGGGSQAEMLMNLMSTMNKQKTSVPPAGLSAIQKIAPNDILGVMLKHYSKK